MTQELPKTLKMMRIRLFKKKTFKEIGKEFGVSKERVRQLICREMRRSEALYYINSLPPEAITINTLCDAGEMSERARNCLVNNGYNLLSELSSLSMLDLLRMPNLGRKKYHEVQDILKKYGFKS